MNTHCTIREQYLCVFIFLTLAGLLTDFWTSAMLLIPEGHGVKLLISCRNDLITIRSHKQTRKHTR